MKKVILINGPNLNLLGTRETGIYGLETLNDIISGLHTRAKSLGITLLDFQSNNEGNIIDSIHNHLDADGIIINPAAYSHYSIAILDALKAFNGIIIEVHISNVHEREDFRKNLLTASAANAVLSGFGSMGYTMALDYLSNKFSIK